MRYYLLDDDINIVKILQSILEEDFSRDVVGKNIDPVKAIDEILALKPDAVLIDYLMPGIDGVDVIEKVKSINPVIEFVMISQIADKKMIGEAYDKGLTFFISKPINKIEVNSVLKNLESHITTTKKLNQIVSLIGGESEVKKTQNELEVFKYTLRDIGIMSEKGSKDILTILSIVKQEELSINEAFDHYAMQTDEKLKSIRQRIRRAIAKALRNIAYLGIEDYSSERFMKYANRLFDFETVKIEMDLIRSKSKVKPTISIDRFMENLLTMRK